MVLSSSTLLLFLTTFITLLTTARSFALLSNLNRSFPSRLLAAAHPTTVLDLPDETSFDSTLSSTPGLLVVNFSTKYCGPCKQMAPKFNQLPAQFPAAVFARVISDGSSNHPASKLFKREKVRNVPSFQFFKGGALIDEVTGPNMAALEGAIKLHNS
jgi:thioredoxin 1